MGKGEYTVFLTSDHGAPYAPEYLLSKKIPAGLFDLSKLFDDLNEMLFKQYEVSDLVLSRINNQIFFNHQKINEHKLDLKEIKEVVGA